MLALYTAALQFPGISPAIFEVDLGFVGLGEFPVRWYALAYIAGLIIGWRYALLLVRTPRLWGGKSPATKDDIDDLLFYVTLGVILGGRIGYILFYQIPFQFETLQRDPWGLLRIWEGGMSFHGGLIGVTLAILIVAWQRGLKLMPIADIAAIVTPIGLFFGRLANFVNAELYGRPTSAPIGMVFPEGNAGGTPSAYDWQTGQWVYTGAEVPRHPSQLYEAVLEGLIPALLISFLVWRFGLLKRPGLAVGLFLLLYGFGRSISEQFREPDRFTWGVMPEWLTMGQLLSLPLWIGGVLLVWNALRKPPLQASA